MNNTLDIDILETKSFKKTFKLLKGAENSLNIKNATKNQISIAEKGNNVIISIYENVDKTNLLGTITLTNGTNLKKTDSSVILKTDDFSWDMLKLNENTIFTAPIKNGNKYSGTWLHELSASTASNETFSLGAGYDSILWDFSGNKKHGNDTINVGKNEILNLNSQGDDNIIYKYYKSGSNAVINAQKEVQEFINDYYRVEGSIIQISKKKYSYTFTMFSLQEDRTYSEIGTTYNGTVPELYFNELKNLFPGKNIELGKTYNLYVGLEKGFNPAKFYNALKKEDAGALTKMKDKLKYNPSTKEPAEYISEPFMRDFVNITLKNYFKLGADYAKTGDNPTVTGNLGSNMNNAILAELNKSYNHKGEAKKVTITDTFLSDEFIYGSDNDDKINITGGEDFVTGGKGNDTINLTGSNTNIYYSFDNNDGKDTVNIGKNSEAHIYLNSDGKNQGNLNGLIYTKSGNNLVISNLNNISENNITIKNYLNGKTNPDVLTLAYKPLGEEELTYINPDFTKESYLSWFGSDEKKNTITASKFNDEIFAGKMTTKISAGEGNNKIYLSDNGQNISVASGKGNDNYFINDLSKTVTINDKGGENDKLIFSDGSQNNERHFYFEVKQKNGIAQKASNDLNIIYKSDEEDIDDFITENTVNNKIVLSPSVRVQNYFTSGKIEDLGDTTDYDFDGVKQEVANWLADNGFASTTQFFSKGAGENTAELAKELFGIYDSGFKPIE